MALSFHPTTAPLFGHRLPPAPDMMSFLQDADDDDGVHSEVTDALLGFVYDPLDASNAALDDLLSLPPTSNADAAAAAAFLAPLDGATRAAEWHCGKRQRIGTGNQQVGALTNDEYILQLPLPLPPPPPPLPLPAVPIPVPVPTQVPEPLVFVRGADANKAASGGACQSVNSAARQRRKRISEKTAELARLIPGAHKLNTAEMLEEAARHVKLLRAQVGVLALMRATAGASSEMKQEVEKMPSSSGMAQERMHALLASGSVQERLAAEGKCLVPTTLVDAVAKDDAVKANPVVRRDLGRFVASLQAGQ